MRNNRWPVLRVGKDRDSAGSDRIGGLVTRTEKVLVGFLCVLVAGFAGENVYLVVRAENASPSTVAPSSPCYVVPAPKPRIGGSS